MTKSILPDVDIEIIDGGLGLTSADPSGIHVKIGVSTTGDTGVIYRFTSGDQAQDKLGAGPLVDALLDSFQHGSQLIYAVKAAAAVDGSISAITKSGTGTATAAAEGTPNDAYEIVIEVLKAGALNEAQVQYSLDGGDSWSSKKTVPTNGVLEIAGTGVTVTFTAGNPASGSFVVGDSYSLTTAAPAMSNQSFLDAIAVLENTTGDFEFIHVVGESAPALWAVAAAKADGFELNHIPLHIVLEARNKLASETLEQYVQALLTDAATFSHTRVSVVAGRLELAALDGKVRDTNMAGAYNGIVSKAKVQESPGKVMSYKLTAATALKPDGIEPHIAALDAAGYVTARKYQGMSGIYVTNGRMMAPLGSDYEFVETRRVADKASRKLRNTALKYVHYDLEMTEDGELDLTHFKAQLEAPLDEMAKPSIKEIAGYELTIDPTQNVISSKQLVVDLSIFPTPIMRWITIRQKMKNPFLKG